ncbi:MAG: hypothetical protein DMG58_20685 [Acidobacteria bacterium]|nr:MAG: hypothetical protein DMG58_20685 [Acidobacteriota bacterium]
MSYDHLELLKMKITSYDSGYEHSPEHWVDLQQLVEQADEQESDCPTPLLATRSSSLAGSA